MDKLLTILGIVDRVCQEISFVVEVIKKLKGI
jgi:hypothetical protein